MLVTAPKRHYDLKRLHVYDQGGRNSISGINATVFGASSTLGMATGSMLTRIGSTVIYPYRRTAGIWEFKFKEIKPTADLGYKAYVKLMDMTNVNDIRHVIRDQNVVINCIGSKSYTKTEKDFEDANIRVPMAIAKVAAENPNVKRFIHISAAGADPNSHSPRLRSKWIGEQEVKEIFPDVTILRPTLMLQNIDPNATIVGKWGMMMKMFNRMNFVIKGQNAQVQPVFANDVALAIYNCIKMEETIGQTYDLGGPHTYSYEDLYKHMFHLTEIKPYSVEVPLELAYEYK
jgi:NADH dehydrogenase (ubiquinone) 1 alpha subcomplex subunit 9